MEDSRKEEIRKSAINTLELTKGFIPEQRKLMGNMLSTMEELAGYILELTDSPQYVMVHRDNELVKIPVEFEIDTKDDYDIVSKAMDIASEKTGKKHIVREKKPPRQTTCDTCIHLGPHGKGFCIDCDANFSEYKSIDDELAESISR